MPSTSSLIGIVPSLVWLSIELRSFVTAHTLSLARSTYALVRRAALPTRRRTAGSAPIWQVASAVSKA